MKVTSNRRDFYQIKQEKRKPATVSAVIFTLPPHFSPRPSLSLLVAVTLCSVGEDFYYLFYPSPTSFFF